MVSLDRLIDQLWGDDPPPQATASLQAYISHLRRLVEPDRRPREPTRVLVTQPPGYVLRAHPDQIDAARFAALAAEGRQRLAEGSPAIARRQLQEALLLWRGPALADFAYEDFARTEAARLEELRLAALEDRLEADIALGSHAAVVAELEQLVAAHPLAGATVGSLSADRRKAFRRLRDESSITFNPARCRAMAASRRGRLSVEYCQIHRRKPSLIRSGQPGACALARSTSRGR